MAHSVGHRSAAIFTLNSLPAAAQAKSRRSLTISDLHSSQQAQANGRDVVAIIDGAYTHILSPTGDFAAAVLGIREERELQGI